MTQAALTFTRDTFTGVVADLFCSRPVTDRVAYRKEPK